MNSYENSEKLGPLATLLADPQVQEIMVDGPQRISVVRKGRIVDEASSFENEEQLLEAVQVLLKPQGRVLDVSAPILDARLQDGSRMSVVLPPVATAGPSVVIRKLPTSEPTIEDLIRWGSWTQEIVEFLQACVVGQVNILVSGGTGSGKTTILKLLATMIPEDERIITIEDAAEFRLPQRRVVGMVSRGPDSEGKGLVTIRDLLRAALRMRPDRLVVGELLGPEVLDMLAAWDTGLDGSMATIHATSPRDALARIEMLASMTNTTIPLLTIRQQLASALQLIVQQQRGPDGTRRITHLSEVLGLEQGQIVLQNIFVHEEGRYRSTGHVPTFLQRLRERGAQVSDHLFGT